MPVSRDSVPKRTKPLSVILLTAQNRSQDCRGVWFMKAFHSIVEDAPAQAADGRYEFRIWPSHWPRAAALIQKFWLLAGAERRSDIYLLTSCSPRRLVKLRAGNRLESKRRGSDLGVLQYWTPHPYPMFPLSRETMRQLARELEVAPLPDESGISPGHLVARLGRTAPEVRVETVCKSRLLFRNGSTRAELCRVAVADQTRPTLAIEDPDPESARRTLDLLGIGHLINRSYGEMLCRRVLPAAKAGPVRNPAI